MNSTQPFNGNANPNIGDISPSNPPSWMNGIKEDLIKTMVNTSLKLQDRKEQLTRLEDVANPHSRFPFLELSLSEAFTAIVGFEKASEYKQQLQSTFQTLVAFLEHMVFS
jgi:hypothetical protein